MNEKTALQDEYLRLTREVLPRRAREEGWVLRHDHCFMRVLLDHVFDDCWYRHLDRRQPAYRQLTEQQLAEAVDLAREILYTGDRLLKAMNDRSLRLRGKAS